MLRVSARGISRMWFPCSLRYPMRCSCVRVELLDAVDLVVEDVEVADEG
jgi:hypothetical protein